MVTKMNKKASIWASKGQKQSVPPILSKDENLGGVYPKTVPSSFLRLQQG